MKSVFTLILIAGCLLGASAVYAGSVTLPNTFSSGTPAKAAEVNANFTAVKTAVDDNDTRVTNLESSLSNKVNKSGDTMTGTLNLPTNGLVAGTDQLVLSGGNIGIGTTTPHAKLEIQGNGRQFITGAGGWFDLSSNGGGHGFVGGNMYTANTDNTIRYSQTHANIGAIGFAVNYPGWNTASIISSGTSSATAGEAFTPQTIAVFDNGGTTLSGNLSLPVTTATTGIIKQGADTLIHTYGTENFFAGIGAGNLTMTGSYNTATGSFALSYNTTGYFNTATGANELYYNTTGYYNTANGYGSLFYNTSGYFNTASGGQSLSSNTTGVSNTASGTYALDANTTGNYNTALGYNADVSSGNLNNATAIGNGAIVDASNKVVIGNMSVTSIGGYAAWSNFSDRRSKTDVQDLEYGLDFIKRLRPVSFKMKDGNGNTDFGFIAQDIEALMGTEYNVLDIGGSDERMLSLRYTQFIAPMVKAMQEQQGIIELQKTKIQSLEDRLARLEALMSGN